MKLDVRPAVEPRDITQHRVVRARTAGHDIDDGQRDRDEQRRSTPTVTTPTIVIAAMAVSRRLWEQGPSMLRSR
jgi:hypothetical protein